MKIKLSKKYLVRIFDIQEIIALLALGMIFYGFYIWKPFLAFIVVGFILLFLLTGMDTNDKNSDRKS